MRRILLVDDSKLFYELFRKIFKNYEVIWADEGEKGIELFRKYRPDVVVIDLILPDMNGVKMVERIREFDKNAKLIVLSGIERSEVISDVLDAGADEYIPKLAGVEVLREKILKFLESQNSSAGHFPRQSRQ